MTLGAITLVRYGGWLGLALLLMTLCASPLGRVLSRRGLTTTAQIARVRRKLGIAAASCALWHALAAFALSNVSFALMWSWPQLRAGVLAMAILSALLLTSFPPVVRALHLRTWKALHRLAYAAAALTLLHVLLAPFASTRLVLSLYAVTALVALLRALPRKEPQPALRE